MRRVTKHEPRMWGPSIVGFGSYHYKYASGHEGDSALAAFAVRGRELVVYIAAGFEGRDGLLAKLGKHKAGKVCVYIRRLANVDLHVLKSWSPDRSQRRSVAIRKPMKTTLSPVLHRTRLWRAGGVGVMHFISAAVVTVSAMLQLQDAAVTGRVVDAAGRAVPGATVRISGTGGSASAVSDGSGRFRVDDLVGGTYVVTVSLAGFRTQTTTVQADSPAGPELVVTLSTGVLSEVLWVVPHAADAYRMAAAIAHVRIDGTRRYGPCGDAHVVTSHHDASVLRVFKGRVSATIQLDQDAAGRCSERGKWHEGVERPYRAGEEYVVFLTERPHGFARLAGPSLAFRVRGGLVSLEGFAGVQGSISLNELGDLLDRLSRNAPPNTRWQPAAAGLIMSRRG